MHMADSIVPQELDSHRFQELDALRGLAAITVVLSHFALVFPTSRVYQVAVSTPLHLFLNGPEAVILFFLLSGFVLSALWSRSRKQGYAKYCSKRLIRLCIPFYAALLIAYLFDLHFYSPVPTSNAWMNATWTMKPEWPMALRVALTDAHWAGQLNTAFWTITYEIRISLFFPLLYWVVMRAPAMGLLAALVAIQSVVPVAHALDKVVDADLVSSVIEFAVGILLYRELPRLLRWSARLTRQHRVLILASSLLLYGVALRAPDIKVIDVSHVTGTASAWTNDHKPAALLDQSARAKILRGLVIEAGVARLELGILGAAGVVFCATTMTRVRTWLHRPMLLRLGALSYSTYLLHGTVLFFLIRMFYGKAHFLYLLPLYLGVVYFVSELFHWAVDRPSILLARHAGSWLTAKEESRDREYARM